MPDWEELLGNLYKSMNKEAPAVEEGAGTVYNKKALNDLKAQRDLENSQASDLAASDSNDPNAPLTSTPLAGKLNDINTKQLPATLDNSNLPSTQVSSGLPATSTLEGDVVGQGTSSASPSDPAIKDADIVADNDGGSGGGDSGQAALPAPADDGSIASKWNKYKLAAAAAGAGGAGLALNAALSPGQAAHVAPPPSNPPAQGNAGSKDDFEEDDEDEDETPAAKAPAKPAVPAASSDDDEEDNSQVQGAKGYANIGNLAQFQKILQQSQQQQQNTQAARIATAMIATTLNRDNKFEPALKSQQEMYASQPGEYLQQVQAQKIDPNSSVSSLYRDIAQKYGLNAPKDASASDLTTLFPQLESFKQHEDNTAMRQLVAQGNQQTKQMQYADLAQRRQQAQDQHNIDKQNATYNNTVQLLEQARGAPDFAQAEKDIYATGKVNTLMNTVGDPNNLNPQMAHLLASEVSKVASGGTSSIAELNALNPNTLNSKYADFMQKITSNPTPANVGALLKNYQNYANDISKTGQQLISDRYNRIIGSRGSQFTDDQNDFLNKYYINRFANQGGPANNNTRQPAAAPKASGQTAPPPPPPSSGTVVMKGPGGTFNVPVEKQPKFEANGYTVQ